MEKIFNILDFDYIYIRGSLSLFKIKKHSNNQRGLVERVSHTW